MVTTHNAFFENKLLFQSKTEVNRLGDAGDVYVVYEHNHHALGLLRPSWVAA